MYKNKTIIGTGIGILLLVIVVKALAGSDPNAVDNARIKQLQDEINYNQQEYVTIQSQEARNQSRCALAMDEQRQMTSLNSANNAKREELQFLQSKVNPQTPGK